MYRFILMACCLVMLHGQWAKAQNICQEAFRGHVVDSINKWPIMGATIELLNNQGIQVSSNDGYFEWNNLCSGTYFLQIKKEGYKIKVDTIILPRPTAWRISLIPLNETLKGVIIREKRARVVVEPEIKLQSEALFQTQGQSLGKALEVLPGVYTVSTGQSISKPVVHGLHSNRVLVINNGIRQEGQQWGNEHAPELDPFQANEIQLISGPQALRFGADAMGGVIWVSSGEMQHIDKTNIELRAMGCSNGQGGAISLLGETKLKQHPAWTLRAQGTLRRLGNLKTPQYFLGNTGLYERDFSFSLGYKKKQHTWTAFYSNFYTQLGILTTSHVGNLSDLYAAFQRERPIDSSQFTYAIGFPNQEIHHQLAKVNWSRKVGSFARWQVQYALQHNRRKEFDKTLQTLLPDGSYKPALDFELLTQQLDVSFAHQQGQLGVSAQLQTNDYYGAYLVPNYVRYQSGLYINQHYQKHHWLFEFSGRYDISYLQSLRWVNHQLQSNTFQYHGPACLVGAKHQGQQHIVYLYGGTTWRPPHVNELLSYGVHHSAATFEMGDSTLKPERSYQFNVSLEKKATEPWYWQGGIYGHYIHHFIYLKPVFPATLTLRGAFPTFQYTGINAYLSGVDIQVGTSHEYKWQVHSKASYLYTFDPQTRHALVGMPPARIDFEAIRLFKQASGDKSQLSFKTRYTFKASGLASGSDYLPAPAAYWLCGLWWQTGFHWDGIHWQVQAGIDNLLNTKYRDYLNRYRYFANEPGRNVVVRIKTNW